MENASGRNDEEQIRELVTAWMSATKRGDLDALLAMVADDAVFLTPGQKPMSKDDFASLQKAQWAKGLPGFEATSTLQEIKVLGDWAFMWTKLAIAITPHEGPPIARSGHTLSLLKREQGRWLLARDANMLAPAPTGPQ